MKFKPDVSCHPDGEPRRVLRQIESSLELDAPSSYSNAQARPLKRSFHLPRPPKRLLISCAVLLVLSGGAFAAHKLGPKYALKAISVINPTRLKGEDRGHTNYLLMGMTQDGLRTDSIILASYYYKENKMVTLNIPRDLYAYDGYENAKMGEIYSYAKTRQPNNKAYPDQYVRDFIAKEYGIPIDYYAELNMQGEVDLINSVGGIDVGVPDPFTDYEYPTANYSGYVRPAPHFVAGMQHMNGDKALIFSRSRHSLQNNEGSDFARSRRQALVIQATLSKTKSQGIVGNIAKLNTYTTIINKNVNTDLSTPEVLRAASIFQNFSAQNDYLAGNWSNQSGFLCDSTNLQGAYVLRYGVPGNCRAAAGLDSQSPYRLQAVNYVQNLLQSLEPKPANNSTSTLKSSTPATTNAIGP